MRNFVFLSVLSLSVAGMASAETYTLTLKHAVDRAVSQNPETVMARLDELKATLGVRVANGPFTTHFGVGSGVAYSNGFPLSIEGSAPAAFEAKADQYLYNRPQTYAVRQAKEAARGAGFATGEKSDEVAWRVASLYVDAARAGRLADSAKKQIESLEKVLQTAQARVEEGRELPITAQQANVNLLRARQRYVTLESDREFRHPKSRRHAGLQRGRSGCGPVEDELTPPAIPATEEGPPWRLRPRRQQGVEADLQSTYSAKESWKSRATKPTAFPA